MHLLAMSAGSLNCWHCGEMYTRAELAVGRAMMSEMLKRKISYDELIEEMKQQELLENHLNQVLLV